jgi:hypothetical protein
MSVIIVDNNGKKLVNITMLPLNIDIIVNNISYNLKDYKKKITSDVYNILFIVPRGIFQLSKNNEPPKTYSDFNILIDMNILELNK